MKKFAAVLGVVVLMLVLGFIGWIWTRPERGTTGQVATRFRFLGPNDRIVVDGFDDPKVQGVACHISRAVTGGVKGGLGFAEDTSDASIACRQVGPIKFTGKFEFYFTHGTVNEVRLKTPKLLGQIDVWPQHRELFRPQRRNINRAAQSAS